MSMECKKKCKRRVEMKMIPLEKQSKAARRKYYSNQRGSWNGVNPVTRVEVNRKAYNRKRDRKVIPE